MRMTNWITVALVCAATIGCQSSSPRGGSAAHDEGFKIVVPSTDTEIKQGQVQTVVVSVQRGESFKRGVTLDIKPMKGLRLDPLKSLIKSSEKPEMQLRITADKDASLGAYRIVVTGTPDSGEAVSVEFTVKVVAP